MKKNYFIILITILTSVNIFCQNSLTSHKMSLGKYSNNSFLGTSALYNKGSGLCEIEKSTLLFSYSNLYSIPQLWSTNVSYVSKQKIGVMPLSLSVVGPSEFCKINFLLGYNLQVFKCVYVGLNILPSYFLIKNNKDKPLLGFQFNANYKHNNKINFGFSLNCPYLIQFTKQSNTSFTQIILELSCLYVFAKKSALSVSVTKNIDNKVDFTFLSIIKLNKKLISSVGYNINNNEVFVNVNIKLNKFTIAITSLYNLNLGFSPELSVLF
jgi:hypothetical protein